MKKNGRDCHVARDIHHGTGGTWVLVRLKKENTLVFLSPFCNANVLLFDLYLMIYSTFGMS